MTEILELTVAIIIVIGAFISVVGSIGVIRLPDVYTRNHAASKGATLGILLILVGAFIFYYMHEGHMNARILLGIVFVFITSPVAGHLIMRSAYNSKVPLWEKSVRDELKDEKRKAPAK